MSFGGRLWDVATGVGGAIQAPVGFVKDLVFEATGVDDDYDGLIGTIWGAGINRASQVAGNLMGPDEGLGAVFGGVPQPLRNPVGKAVGAAMDTVETVGREAIREPLSTLMTAASISDRNRGNLGGFGDLFKASTWSQAYDIAQDRSVGQAIAIALGTKDVLDPKEVNEFVGTDFYNIVSGTFDAAVRMTLDPDVLIGHAAVATKGRYLIRPIRSKMQLDRYFNGPRWEKVEGFLAQHADDTGGSAKIRDRMFPKDGQGDLKAHFLHQARDFAEREKVMRFLMGDLAQIDTMYRTNGRLALQMENLVSEQALIRNAQMFDGTLFADEFLLKNAPHRLEVIQGEMDAISKQNLADAARTQAMFKSIEFEQRLGTVGSGLRQHVKRSDFYQTSPFAKPIRTFTNMRPHRVVDFHRHDASIQLDRQAREAGMTQKYRDYWRSQVDAASPEQRHGIFAAAEDQMFRIKAKQYGLTKAEMKQVLDALPENRKAALHIIRESKYAPDGKALIRYEDDIDAVEYPVFLAQTANAGVMVDFRKVDKALREAGEFKYRQMFPGKDSKVVDWTDKRVGSALRAANLPQEAVTSIMKLWKPAVLLRPAWTMRVVVMDEQFRMMAKYGALANVFDALHAGRDLTAAAMKEVFGDGGTGWLNKLGATKGVGAIGSGAGMLMGGPAGALVGGVGGAVAGRALSKVKPAAYRQLEANGYKIMSHFGAPGDEESFWRAAASADDGTREFLSVHEDGILAKLRRGEGWQTTSPGQKTYKADWERVVNDQLIGDQLARQFIEGKSHADIKAWLMNTPEGARYRAALPRRVKKGVDEWIETAQDLVDHLIPDVGDLRAKALTVDKRLKYDDMAAHLPESEMPTVHGQLAEQIMGRGAINSKVRDFTDRWFHILGTLPTDHLSRNRYFRHVYEDEMLRRLHGIPAGRIQESTLRAMEDGARNIALKETRDLLYDFAERSEFADLVKNIIPFFPAFQEVLTRWAGLAMENPAFVANAAKILGAPSKLPEEGVSLLGWKASWYKDDQGEGYMQFRLPDWAKGLVNHGMLKSAIDSQGYVRFDPKSFSMVGSGTPGFGPFVQIAASEVVKNQPSLEESLKVVLPFGVQGEWVDVFMPAHGKRLMSRAGEDENRAYANAYYRTITTKLTQMRNGEIAPVDLNDPVARGKFLDGVKSETNAFFSFRWFASLLSPVTPMFDSPYQAQIDAYRAKKLVDPEHADDWFLENYGEEFFALTQSFTKSTNGIPPTLTGLATEQKYNDLLVAYPEFGALVSGAEGSGMTDKFSRAVYDRQLDSEFVPGSGINERVRLKPGDIIEGPDVRLAWSKFSRAMDSIEAVRLQRGLPNLRVKGAEDLAEAKRQIVNELAIQYPAWGQEYFTVDLRSWQRKIEGLTAIANTPGLNERPAIAGLKDYLGLRNHFIALLNQRESHDIEAASNADLSFAWESAKAQLASEPAFGDLFSRWLSNDPLESAA